MTREAVPSSLAIAAIPGFVRESQDAWDLASRAKVCFFQAGRSPEADQA